MEGIVTVDRDIDKRRVNWRLLFRLSFGLFGLYLVNPLDYLLHLADFALEVE